MFFVDLSSNNPEPNWGLLKRSAAGVMLKATEGGTWNDPDFKAWAAKARRAGLRVGAYHYARPDLHPYGAEIEAKHFCSVIGKLGRRDFKPVLDFESHSRHLSRDQMVRWARKFNHVVKDRLGVWPLFYSYSAFIHELAPKAPIGGGLWLADYGRNDGKTHTASVPAPWKHAVAHQYSSRCLILGCKGNVDGNLCFSKREILAHPVLGFV